MLFQVTTTVRPLSCQWYWLQNDCTPNSCTPFTEVKQPQWYPFIYARPLIGATHVTPFPSILWQDHSPPPRGLLDQSRITTQSVWGPKKWMEQQWQQWSVHPGWLGYCILSEMKSYPIRLNYIPGLFHKPSLGFYWWCGILEGYLEASFNSGVSLEFHILNTSDLMPTQGFNCGKEKFWLELPSLKMEWSKFVQ